VSVRYDKLGLVFRPDRSKWWMRSHAMNPTPRLLKEGPLVKVYFAGRDDNNRSQTGWVILDMSDDFKVIDMAAEPVISLGRLGTFDDNGIAPISLVDFESKTYLYYVGFKPGGTTRMDLYGGLAISDRNEDNFQRFSEAPLLGRTPVNPLINTAPFVLRDNSVWRMYYVAGLQWFHKDLPSYNIQYAESRDGITWDRTGQVAIDFKDGNECALAKPWVVKHDGGFEMWYSYKGKDPKTAYYQIGYATSTDGINWTRKDEEVGISLSKSGWDSDMMEYATVVQYNGKNVMFYNGNGYGSEGFGVAVER